MLKSKNRTFIKMPREMWPDDWEKKGYKNPVVLLVRALYGHPEAGAHWENHLTDILIKLGGEALPSHPSTFWFKEWGLLLTVYVDDLMLSGPEEHHDTFWGKLVKEVKIEEPEALDRFLGRYHEIDEITAPAIDVREFFEPEEKVVTPAQVHCVGLG